MDFIQGKKESGIVYESNITVGELVDKDTDGDGIPDWEEPLYGLDPTKKETVPGTPDSTTLSKMKIDQSDNTGTTNVNTGETENLTQTDKFSRELFSTVASLSQNGSMSQETIDKISGSLAENIKNAVPRKVFTASDLKISKDNSAKALKDYAKTLDSINKKYPVDENTIIKILQKFIIDENNVDESALSDLNPIIKNAQDGIAAAIKMSVPSSLAPLHLDLINAGERISENLSDIKLFDTDPIIALGAISQYEENTTKMGTAVIKLAEAIEKRFNN